MELALAPAQFLMSNSEPEKIFARASRVLEEHGNMKLSSHLNVQKTLMFQER